MSRVVGMGMLLRDHRITYVLPQKRYLVCAFFYSFHESTDIKHALSYCSYRCCIIPLGQDKRKHEQSLETIARRYLHAVVLVGWVGGWVGARTEGARPHIITTNTTTNTTTQSQGRSKHGTYIDRSVDLCARLLSQACHTRPDSHAT